MKTTDLLICVTNFTYMCNLEKETYEIKHSLIKKIIPLIFRKLQNCKELHNISLHVYVQKILFKYIVHLQSAFQFSMM